jgi:hydroxyethylthiazole kinase-like uncharacterized protein yjeF
VTPLDELLATHPLPRPSGGKDDKGTVVVVGGPPSCPGAAVLSGTAALAMGAGRVQLCVDPTNRVAIGVAVPEAAVVGWDLQSEVPAELRELLADADVVLIGVGHREIPSHIVRAVAEATNATLLLDAGALGATLDLAQDHALVIAPNPSEAAGLLGADESDEEQLATALQARVGQAVAVRGTIAVVADADGVWSYDALPDGLGTPGSGDVFAGTLAALLGNGCKPTPALGWAVALHARAASHLAENTPVGYLARDVVRELPYALAEALR